ncbi:MAG TPA: AAA family ATPase [Tepidisphaeraceae bacterium]|jgi:ATP-dependent Clp protease ATP-binding subunit ClpC
MPAYRFPILLIRDAAGFFTALPVEDHADTAAAFAATPADARQQVRDCLERLYRDSPWRPEPDFADPSLSLHRVDVRPEYQDDDRVYPCGETIPLRLPVVTGHTEAGLRVAALPTLGIRFSYYADDDVKPLVIQYVHQHFKGQTPAQLARFLAPAHAELDDVVIQIPRELRPKTTDTPEIAELAAVADPLASRELRNRYARAWEREDLVARLVESLRKETAPILLLGPGGIGKTSILADAARRIERDGEPIAAISDHAPPTRRTHRFWLTSAPRLIAGMQYLGMWQERIETLIAQTASIAAVLCAENLLDLVRTGGRTPTDSIGAFLVPYLQRAELRLVTEATPTEFDAVRRLLPALADLFQVITVPPLSRDRAIACLDHVAAAHRQTSRIDAESGVTQTVHRLFARFMPYEPFPGKSALFLADLFDRAARDHRPRVTAADALDLFIHRTGLPELFLRDDTPLDPERVVQTLHQDVIGQPRACRAAVNVVTTFKAGLNDPTRPLGVLLFAGPTGVGKTQLALSLAQFLFGAAGPKTRMEDGGWKTEAGHGDPSSILHPPSSSSRLIRLDLSEYATPGHAAERFLGSADTAPADWIQKIRQQPFTVLLLDEIEKAAPEIFDVLLGVFDEGRLTDPWGRLTHFNSAVIIMTTNLGAATGEPFGLSPSAQPAQSAYDAEIANVFRPEFVNRIDAIVPFDPLTPESIQAIAEKELRDLSTREGLAKSNLRLEWTPAVIDLLAATGFDPRYGARPLQRALETLIVTPLAKYLVSHPKTAGRLRLDVDAAGQILIA